MKFLCILTVVCGLASLASALDREAFSFTNYDLNVRIEPEQQRLAVRGKITLRNDSTKAQDNLALQISSSLDWRAIRVGGKAAHFVTQEYNSDIDHSGSLSEAIVDLPQEIPPKGTVELEVGYEGVIPLDTSRLTRIGVPEDKAKHTDWDQISKSFTAVRGIGYVVWYPVATEDASLSEGNSVAETIGRWQAREANAEMLVSLESTSATPLFSGTVENTGSSSSKAGRFSMGGLSFSVPTFVVADYQKLTPKDKDSDSASIYYLAGQQDRAESYAEVVTQVEPIIPGSHGTGTLKIVALPDPDAQPFATEGMLLTPLNSPMTNEAELSIVYAKARQLLPSPRAWIQDGLAHYAQVEFIAQQKGRQAALDYLTSHAAGLIESGKQTPEKLGDRDSARSLISASDDLYLQTKAMYVWWMLKDMLGNQLNEALLNYDAGDDKDATYMQHLLEKASHRDLQWFFDDWVYHDRGLPDFHVNPFFSTARESGGFLVTITVENSGNAGAEVPLTLQMESGEIRRRIQIPAKSKASLRVEVQTAPQQVTVNDGSVPESDTSHNTYKIEVVSH
jgi:hypothetical protein